MLGKVATLATIMSIAAVISIFSLFNSTPVEANNSMADSIYDITATDIDGNTISMSEYRGKVLLIVNVASKCGYTPQYEGLEALYQQFKDEGLVVLGVPSNDFGAQEPGTEAEIKEFCSTKFNVTFPMLSKAVVKGSGKSELYELLTNKKTNPIHGGEISWNFNKFLIGKNGMILNRFASADAPMGEKVVGEVERALFMEY